ncbi:MAG: tetratricopeptide repeat protein [Saprospiraceae bacterium]|nr:tetratricopeptide repeat protein [Saprospiraceae bacterium]
MDLKYLLLYGLYFTSFTLLQAQTKNPEIKSPLPNSYLTLKADTANIDLINNIAFDFYRTGKNDSSISASSKALELSDKINYTKGKARAYSILGVNFFDIGNFPESIENYLLSLKACEELGGEEQMATIYSNIGNVYRKQNDTKNAIKYQEKALNIFEKNNNKKGIAKSLIGFALIYKQQNQLQKSMNAYNKAIKIFNELNDIWGLSIVYNNIGNLYREMSKYNEAISALKKSLELCIKLKNEDEVARTSMNIGEVYLKINQPGEAKYWFQKSLNVLNKNQNKEVVAQYLLNMSRIDSIENNYKGAFNNFKKYLVYRDSLFNEESIRKVTKAGLNYQFEKQKAVLKIENEKKLIKTRFLWISISGVIFFLAIISFGLYMMSKSKRKKEKLIQEQKQKLTEIEKEHLNSQLQRAKNDLKYFVTAIAEKNEIIENIQADLNDLQHTPDLIKNELNKKLVEIKSMQILTDDDWMDFLNNFETIYPQFTIKLKTAYPKLTTSEIRYLMLSKIGINHKQMANTLGVSPDTIRVTWNRVRNKVEGSLEDTPISILEKVGITG